MTTGTGLLDLSDDLLLEVIARVDYDKKTWAALPLVDRRFSNLMAIKSLSFKAAQIQFPELCQLIPTQCQVLSPLKYCGAFARQVWDSFEHYTFPESVSMDFVTMVITLLRVINMHKSIMLDQSLSMDLTVVWLQLYNLRTMRLLPAEVPFLLRYAVWRSDWGGLNVSTPTLSVPVDRARCGQYLVFERVLFSYPLPTDRNFVPPKMFHSRSLIAHYIRMSQDLFRGKKSMVLEKNRCLPSAMQVTDAIIRLRHSPFAFTYAESILNLQRTSTPQDFDMLEDDSEIDQQLKTTTEFCERVETDGGRYGQELVQSLDLRAIGRILYEQASEISEMKMLDAQKSLAEEVQFLID